MVTTFPSTCHMFSHQLVTFLDTLVSVVDARAKVTLHAQPDPLPVGYLSPFGAPTTCFVIRDLDHNDISMYLDLLATMPKGVNAYKKKRRTQYVTPFSPWTINLRTFFANSLKCRRT